MSFAKIAKNASDEFLAWIVDEYPETFAYVTPKILFDSIENFHVKFPSRVIDSGFDINVKHNGETLIECVIPYNDKLIYKLLKKDNIDIDIKGVGNCASFLSEIACDVRLLPHAMRHVKSSIDLGEAVIHACVLGSRQALEILLAHPCANINFPACSTTPLIEVVKNSPDLLEFILEQPGIDVNKLDVYGRTAFMVACSKRRVNMARKIAQHPSFNFDVRGAGDRTPIEHARHTKLNKLASELEMKRETASRR